MANKKQQTEIVRNALKQTYKKLDDKALEQTTRETLLAPRDRVIDVGGKQMTASDLRHQLAQKIENIGSGGENVAEAHDFQMMVAHSIETINSETSSSQEYFRWLDDASEIIKNMNDGFVSEADLDERNAFIDMSHQRETELLVCLSLYSNSNNPQAAQKAEQIRYKLKKLREMRSAIENSTKDKADVRVTEEEYHNAVPYYKLYKGLAKLPFGYDIPPEQKRQLGIDHEDDEDISDDSFLFDQLINAMLDDMRNDDYFSGASSAFYGTENEQETGVFAPAAAGREERLQQIAEKLKELTGRKKTFGVNYAMLEAQKNKLRGKM